SALLFIFIFGYVIGGRMPTIGNHKYWVFVLPGILMMNIVNASFLQASNAIYFSRCQRYVEMILGSLTVVVMRSTVTAIGILVMGVAFGATSIQSIGGFLFWVIGVSAIFGLFGIIIGLWAKTFEQLNVLIVFFIAPLSMVGGVFNTVNMLPPWLRWLALGNPFFYFINGLRYAMMGFNEAPEGLGAAL